MTFKFEKSHQCSCFQYNCWLKNIFVLLFTLHVRIKITIKYTYLLRAWIERSLHNHKQTNSQLKTQLFNLQKQTGPSQSQMQRGIRVEHRSAAFRWSAKCWSNAFHQLKYFWWSALNFRWLMFCCSTIDWKMHDLFWGDGGKCQDSADDTVQSFLSRHLLEKLAGFEVCLVCFNFACNLKQGFPNVFS